MSRIRRDYRPLREGFSVPTMSGMLLRHFVVIARPVEQNETQLATGAQNGMPGLAWKSNGQGQRLLSELGFDVGNRRMARSIEVEIGALRPVGGGKLLPIRWKG